MKDLKIRLSETIDLISSRELRQVCGLLINYPNFFTWPASLSYHHAYKGGLILHTLEVVDYALNTADHFPQVEKDILITACLWHDLMKIKEYRWMAFTEVGQRHLEHFESGYWRKTNEDVRYFGNHAHIIMSAAAFSNHALTMDVQANQRRAIEHCILAHHGPVKEWGSPVAPATIEALILHQADMLSAGYGATKNEN